MKDLTQLQEAHRSQLASEYPWIWLFELEAPTSPPTRYRLTNNTRSVTFGTSSAGVDLVYLPAPIFHGGITQDGSGDLPSIEVSIANFNREISQACATHGGFEDQPVVIRLVQASELTNAQAQLREDGVVRGVRVTSEVVTFTISAGNLYERHLPPYRLNSSACRWRFGGPECGYDLTTGSMTTCSKNLHGADGCVAHGDDEVANSLTRLHPKRYGAFPGVRGLPK